jgi:glutathione S-transferase
VHAIFDADPHAERRPILVIREQIFVEPGEELRVEARGEVPPRHAIVVGRAPLRERLQTLGERFSLADLAVCGYVPYLQFLSYDISSHENIKAWSERCLSRPASRKARGV